MKPASPVRLDALVVERGLCATVEEARAAIAGGLVLVEGVPASRPDARVRPDRQLSLAKSGVSWVSRGALKLLSVLEGFQVDPKDTVCVDLGSSTGGFTQVLLERGATRVYAVDVGKGLLDWRLRQDPRVVVMEGVNARHLAALPDAIDLLVGDLSFISLGLILPSMARLLRPGGEAVVLVKPQFEVRRAAVGVGGRVRTEGDRQAAISKIVEEAADQSFEVIGGLDSGLAGARSGNVEHFLHLRKPHGISRIQ